MSDNNASARLREMLDERGVEWSGEVLADCLIVTMWMDGETAYEFNELIDSNHAYLEMNINPCTPNQAIATTLKSEREKQLELLVNQLWYLVNHQSGYGYAAALEAIEELGIKVGDDV